MEFDAVLIAPRRQESVARGWWRDLTINDFLDRGAASHPDKLALTAVHTDSAEVRRFTYRQLAAMADRVAVGLARLGIGAGDVSSPTWPARASAR